MKTTACILLLLPAAVLAHEPKPASADSGTDYVIRLQQMEKIEAGKGEVIHLLRGDAHGFKNLSFILTQTAPGGGPPLHTHESEEAHVLTSGSMEYVIGDRKFSATAPYILRVPANMPHTFINAGTTPLQLTAVFDSARYTFKPLARNPLQPAAPAAAAQPAAK